MAPEINHTTQKILVIRAGALGDTVCASSIIPALHNQFGDNVIIDWLAKSGIAKVFAQDPRIRNVFEIKSRRTPLLVNPAKLKVIITPLFEPYDYVINLELGSIFNGLMRLIRAKRKIGMPYKYFAEPAESHAVDNLKLIYQSFLSNESVELAEPSLIGSTKDELRNKFNLPENYYVLVPANSHHDKSGINHRAWPVEHWLELLKLMSAQNKVPVIIGGKDEESYFSQFNDLPKETILLAGKTSFPELIGVIDSAQAVITTDTGPSHIAAAVNTPVIALIGPTNFKRTGPYQTKSNKVTIVSVNLPCSPCYHTKRQQDCTKNTCMMKITPDDVYNVAKNTYE